MPRRSVRCWGFHKIVCSALRGTALYAERARAYAHKHNDGLYEAVFVFVETCGFVDADEEAIAFSFGDLNGLPLGTFLIRKGELKEALDE